ncbi:heavy-metal-associated domain-containing protein [Ferruginibacter lapsinanis]|uniref:heavy-metal-associated domain-containing protein n=1 Tax=Ferruginibacter lapsinanis TaxID=563172 RepID=UPI001E5E41E6|nr:heavy-metal-associated domain-containing protein [Ferruginibacter lapsinanis]UEG49699.1 heavy-metal-associated domain-containing protein [Ferruginibacter lapsinanis]
MKKILLTITVLFSFATQAQVTKVSIQASGLTCSMCSNAINKALRSLDFVDKVDANIKNSTFDISFKPDHTVDFDKLKKKVEDAGFFVANFVATIHFDNAVVTNDKHTTINGTVFHFLNVTDQTVNGDKQIRFIDKGFVSAKEFKKNSRFTVMQCYQTGVAEACCTKDKLAKGTRIFHVTI